MSRSQPLLAADLLPKKPRTRRHVYERACRYCKAPFATGIKSQQYCSGRCRTDRATSERDRSPSHWLNVLVTCGVCSKSFKRPQGSSPIRKYCSEDCQRKAKSRYYKKWMDSNPGAMAAYNRARGRDTLTVRLQKRYPDLPNACESCGESRVIELAHKPKFKRNGAWRTIDQYKRHMFWVLCPTCHKVLDRGIQTPKEMRLK
jgi:hypothetical protein